jgi:superfamily II DNA or RNA helicase
MTDSYEIPAELVLGRRENQRVPLAEQDRQRREAEEILHRLARQPGVVLADEVGMGKTFVALATIYCIGTQSRKGPVVVMVPPNLIDKWEQDLDAFCTLYLDGVTPVNRGQADPKDLSRAGLLRYGIARHSVEFLKLLDDKPRDRCHIVFLAQGAMSRAQTDIWVRLALIRETLRRHGRRVQLNKVRKQIHRFLGELLYAKGQQRANYWGEELWAMLLRTDPAEWMNLFNEGLKNNHHRLNDDPVPEAIIKALGRVDLESFAAALSDMPVRARGGSERLSERLTQARESLRETERHLWKQIVAKARWRSPLLVLDEAHHLKNPKTALARQLQSLESDDDLKLGDGALAGSFDRMLFLTATPFQLGHHELVRVLQRFGDVRWDAKTLGEKEVFEAALHKLNDCLTASQRASIRLQRAWSRLQDDDFDGNASIEQWWERLGEISPEEMTHRQKTLVEAYRQAKIRKAESEGLLQPWLVRHNKGETWQDTDIRRRDRLDGAAIWDPRSSGGIDIPGDQLLPFFLAARSAAHPGKDLLGEALCSSYEAFRQTRRDSSAGKDDLPDGDEPADLTQSSWFLGEFDEVIMGCSGAVHPKIHATVQRTVDLWEQGEKVLVFAFYRHTCRALRIHISNELEKRLMTHARRRLAGAGRSTDDDGIAKIIESIHNRYFDTAKAPGRQALDRALQNITGNFTDELQVAGIDVDNLLDIMRRFLRVQTTLVRAFPIHQHDELEPHLAIRSMLDSQDASGLSWREKFHRLLEFLLRQCSPQERLNYLEAAERTQTGRIRVQAGDIDDADDPGTRQDSVLTLANIQVATGETQRATRARLMRSFNTPFFPDIFVCSQVMGEGVDLHRYCRHVIHHDLDWNPSSIEQRTGRVDRLGCKAEGRHPIPVYIPYLAGTADERQYRVMTDRESWFRIVMGQEEVARLIADDSGGQQHKPPSSFQQELVFQLALERCGDVENRVAK